ncbi:cyclin dependent kinase inhibitor 1Ca [Sebastes fasciatus]|uniref:cyclin dependent kinase inhibitor 1Ca n=1 Tax=Sebastes fasciatus TaxID=394691 RepID=UPI003D9EC650
MNPMRHRESVCRSLFGPVDRDQLRRDLTLRLEDMAEQDSRRWNFDFQTETPLSGRFQWEHIPADCAAAAYQEKDVCSSHTEEEDRLRNSGETESAGTDQENCSSISNTHKCPAEVTPGRRKRTHAKSAAKNSRGNARITDFFAKRRRSTETKSILSPFHTSTSEAALCKTIR